MTRHELTIAGCRPEPLASYLKALGMLRLIGEQVDRGALARWDARGFTVQSTLDDQELEDFFLRRYRPTPVVSPWNKASGFGPECAGELEVIEASTDRRLETYRRAIAVARRILGRFSEGDLAKLGQTAGKSVKAEIMRACRSELPDDCLQWMDAVVVLTPGDPAYPPLLGTGGNVGRLELSRNFRQRLVDVLAIDARERRRQKDVRRSEAWLRDSLWDLGRTEGIKESPGQFDPGSTGGTNSSPSGRAPSVLNPWDYVFMVEGSMLFAAGSARRLGVGVYGRSAGPFTANAASVGYAGAAPTEPVKGEVWLPLWDRFVSLAELSRLMAEGRIDWRGRHARTGLDFAKAVATLGVDRGIAAFGRYVLAERFGQSSVAVPAGRVQVSERRESVLPLAEIDGWLNRVRRLSDVPANVRRALRRVDLAAFEVTRGADGSLARVLVEVAALEAAIEHAVPFRDRAGLLPVSGITAARWERAMLGPPAGPTGRRGSRELRLAMALASAHDRADGSRIVSASLRTLLRPIGFKRSGVPEWKAVAPVEGFGILPALAVVARAHLHRNMELLAERKHSRQERRKEAGGDVGRGLPTRFAYGHNAVLADLVALAAGAVDERLFGELLGACLLLDWRGASKVRWREPTAALDELPTPPALAVLGPFYARQPRLSARPLGRPARVPTETVDPTPKPLKPQPEWVALLVAGRAEQALTWALRHLRMAGHDPVLRDGADLRVDRTEAVRLAAALLCPLSNVSRDRLLWRICPPDPERTLSGQGDRGGR